MGSGTGNHFIDSVLDLTFQSASGGIIGFDQKEGLEAGAVIKGVKEITGATQKEEANEDARERFEIAQAESAKQRADNIALSAANELQKSRSAQSSRGGVSGSSKGQSRFSDLGGDEQDFLGL